MSVEKPKSSISVREAPSIEETLVLPFEKEREEISEEMKQLLMLKWIRS